MGGVGGMHLGQHHLHGGVWRVMDTPPYGEVWTARHLPAGHDDDETERRARLRRVGVGVGRGWAVGVGWGWAVGVGGEG